MGTGIEGEKNFPTQKKESLFPGILAGGFSIRKGSPNGDQDIKGN
jgi:hypothetical protein